MPISAQKLTGKATKKQLLSNKAVTFATIAHKNKFSLRRPANRTF